MQVFIVISGIKYFNNFYRCRCDVWFDNLSNYVNVETLTTALIGTSFKFGGWDHIAPGVLDLAMSLLVTSATAVSGRGER